MILWSTRYIVVSGTLEYTDSYGEAQRALRRGKGRPWDGRDGAREGRGRCAGPSSRFCWSHEISKLEGATSQLAHSAWPLGERGNCWMPMSSRRMTGHQHWPAVTSQIKPDRASEVRFIINYRQRFFALGWTPAYPSKYIEQILAEKPMVTVPSATLREGFSMRNSQYESL